MKRVVNSETAPRWGRRAVSAIALVASGAAAGFWHYVENAPQWVDLLAPHGSVRVLIVDNAADRSRGLSHRAALPGDGLLLQWDAAGRRPIWMAEMRFPLDLVWLEHDGRVAGVLHHVPVCSTPTCPLYEPVGAHESVAVLEIAAGSAVDHGIKRGIVIRGLPTLSTAR